MCIKGQKLTKYYFLFEFTFTFHGQCAKISFHKYLLEEGCLKMPET